MNGLSGSYLASWRDSSSNHHDPQEEDCEDWRKSWYWKSWGAKLVLSVWLPSSELILFSSWEDVGSSSSVVDGACEPVSVVVGSVWPVELAIVVVDVGSDDWVSDNITVVVSEIVDVVSLLVISSTVVVAELVTLDLQVDWLECGRYWRRVKQ